MADHPNKAITPPPLFGYIKIDEFDSFYIKEEHKTQFIYKCNLSPNIFILWPKKISFPPTPASNIPYWYLFLRALNFAKKSRHISWFFIFVIWVQDYFLSKL